MMKTARIFFIGLVGLLAAGCNKNSDIQHWVERTAVLRSTAEDQLPHTPYRREQHVAFKQYFSGLNGMVLRLRSDEPLRRSYNEAAARADMNDLCRKVFMPRSRWETLMRNCKKNRFFLCAEEVRAYPEQVSGLRNALNPDLQRKFDRACRSQ